MQNEVYLLLGSNLGNREKQLAEALQKVESQTGTILKASSIYETQAWGKTDQSAFLNQVVMVSSLFSPHELLMKLLKLEEDLGRQRNELWGPRIIDLDILFFGDSVVHQPDLVIPHPEIAKRRFTLVPLVEIAPDFVHPLLKKTSRQLLAECTDPLEVKRFL